MGKTGFSKDCSKLYDILEPNFVPDDAQGPNKKGKTKGLHRGIPKHWGAFHKKILCTKSLWNCLVHGQTSKERTNKMFHKDALLRMHGP